MELRRAGVSFSEIARSIGWQVHTVCYWGQLVLPMDLQMDVLGRPFKSVRLPDVLPPVELRRLRRQGLSYSQIADLKGIRRGVVAQYARVALPPELRTRRSTRRLVRARTRCDRCKMLEEPGNLLKPVEVEIEGKVVTEQWCALCRLEAEGVALLDFFESGAALEYEAKTGEGVWIV